MKSILFFLSAFVLASCASLSPVGNWDYKITGTPQGDYGGVMIVSKKDKKVLAATMKSEGGDLPFSQFAFDPKTKKSTGEFNYQGMTIGFESVVTEKEMNGNISVEGMTFPFKATRKKQAAK